jgi:serine protease AprX
LPFDSSGHGTQTLGLIVAGRADGTAIGVAPRAQWIAVKIFDDAGEARSSGIHQGYQWLLDPDGNPATDDAPHIVNNSWGLEDRANQCVDEFQQDIRALRRAGIAVVFAGGNDGPNNDGPSPPSSVSPANNRGTFAVGAVARSLVIGSTSSRGPSPCDGGIYPEAVAPGVAVRTTDLSLSGAPQYTSISGTSAAAPHVSGAMALLLSADPSLPLSRLERLLKSTARDLGKARADNVYGYGLIDVFAAYNVLQKK